MKKLKIVKFRIIKKINLDKIIENKCSSHYYVYTYEKFSSGQHLIPIVENVLSLTNLHSS